MIYHAARPDDWDPSAPEYRPPSFDADGFVHCSTAAQLEGSVNRFLAHEPELVVLRVDDGRLGATLRWEPGSLGERERFPHVHGGIPRDAVVRSDRWRRGANGFRMEDLEPMPD